MGDPKSVGPHTPEIEDGEPLTPDPAAVEVAPLRTDSAEPHPDPPQAPPPHPIYANPYAAAFSKGKSDPVAAVRLTCESVLQHFRDMAGAYDTLMTKQGSKVRRHEEMQELFADKQRKIEKELKWLDQCVTASAHSQKELLPVLARVGDMRGSRQRAMPWHVLALSELGLKMTEGAALLRMNQNTYVAWLKKAKIMADKQKDPRWNAPKSDWPLTPTHPDQKDTNGDERPPSAESDEKDKLILGDPVKRLQWSTKELYTVAKNIQDEKIRFQYLAELAEGAQKEAAQETEKVAEAAMELNGFIPTLIDALEAAIDGWRSDLSSSVATSDLPVISVRDEAKRVIVGYGDLGKQVEVALEKL